MSLQSWKQEFYPVNAAECPRGVAVAHVLNQWRGLTLENLAKHEVLAHGGRLSDAGGAVFCIDGDSCALCYEFYEPQTGKCTGCPLYKAVGVECFNSASTQPFGVWFAKQNPEPMLAALERCLTGQESK